MNKLRLLLLPLTLIYSIVMQIRNWMYDKGVLKSCAYVKPVICVGNITVGGTGKTPFIEYLISLLCEYKPSIVSRGYKRKTKGLVVASVNSTAEEIGDEPCQMHSKYPNLPIAVAEDRRQAIDYMSGNVDTGVILMDDGYQHRSVKAGMYVLMTDYARPMWKDWTFPAGNMREPWVGRHRADMLVVNKCPQGMTEEEALEIRQKLRVESEVYFTSISYGRVVDLSSGEEVGMPEKVVAVAGIGRPEPFFEEVESRSKSVVRMAFGDHHDFDAADVSAIEEAVREVGEGAVIVTTEKDAMRFPSMRNIKVYYLPIRLEVLFGESKKLNKKLKDYVSINQ